ncbi:phospho-N-acetylmuramoyl-pentapeptide-transferase, partial [Candidatus Uhrbacteria bacterium]|nr:phospho-N-acetylmuramoyl-pentapeptide-transferase [Candidatus Uhrbacteria bacterium]
LDGLSGGTLAAAFAAYSGIAWAQGQVDLAAFTGVIVGVLLAFLWFNIPPARFYMGETGMFGLTTTLAVVAFLTEQVVVLPIIAFPLVMSSASVILQFASKRFLKRKLFRVAPLHHHFEAIGWPAHTVVMRYWVVSVIFALLGMVAALAGRVTLP